ncbi:MAG: hypothetical protein QW327_02960 [Candidatus Odinarchaeota archaeon]
MSKKGRAAIVILAVLIIPLLFLPSSTLSQPVEGTPFEVKPVGIVFSNLSLTWKQISYNNSNITTPVIMSFYVVESSIYMAGLRFEVIPEENITSSETLQKYSCIILPDNTYISNSTRLELLNYYKEYLENGGSIIAFGYVGLRDENNTLYTDKDVFLKTLFNIKMNYFLNESHSIITLNHPVTVDYPENTTLHSTVFGIDNMTVNSTSISTQTFLKAVDNETGTLLTYCGFTSQIGDGRSVFINVYDLAVNPWFDQTTLLLRALQWCIFRDYPAVGLQPTPGRLTWIFTVDQDWCFATVNTTTALRRLLNLADTYYFTFGWAIISEGPVKQSGEYYGFINWTACKPLFLEAYSKGHDLTSHSVTHVYWDLTPVNDTRVLNELNLSRHQIEGNLSIPVTGLQVWGQGIWFSRYNASIYLPQVGYQYITELSIKNFPYLIGREFYYTGDGNIDFNNTVFVLFRQSYSDHNFFSPTQMNLNWSDAWQIEKEIFDTAYRIGNGMPYTILWHDYSLDNSSRLPLLYRMLDYEVWQKTDVYTCTPYEYYHRIQARDSVKYNVTYYSNNTITITLDTGSIGDEYLEYITGQTVRIDNTSLYVQSVKIDSNDYLFYSNTTIILPQLTKGVHTITVSLDSQPSTQPHITGCTFGGPISASSATELFTFNFTSPHQKNGRVTLEPANTPVTVFVNRTLTDKWYYDGKKMILSLNASGNTLIEVYYSLKFSSNILGVDKHVYFPTDPVIVDYTLTNNYPFTLNLKIKAIVSIGDLQLGESELPVTIGSGQTYSGKLTVNPSTAWPAGNLTIQLQVISGYAVLTYTVSSNSVYVYWFNGELIIASISVIAVFAAIIALTNKFIESEKIKAVGSFFSNGLFTASPIIFNLGFILVLGYHYSRILNPVDVNTLTLIFTVTIPLAFTFYGLDYITRRYTEEAALSEDTTLTKTYVKQTLLTSLYISLAVTGALTAFAAFTGIIPLDSALQALTCIIPNIFLLSLIGAYKALGRLPTLGVTYLTAMMAGVVTSLYITYYLGVLGVILPYSISLTIACVFLGGYLLKHILRIGSLPMIEPSFRTRLFKETRFNLKSILLGALIINLLLLTNYLVWLLQGWSTAGYTILLNPQLQTPILVYQLTVFPVIGVGGLLISRVEAKLNEFSRQILAKRKGAVDEYSDLLKTYKRLLTVTALTSIIIVSPVTYFLKDICLLFNLTLTVSTLEIILLGAGYILFSILLVQILFNSMIELKSSCISLSVAVIITIIVSLTVTFTGFLNPFTSIVTGFICGLSLASAYSITKVLKKLKQARRF